MTYFIVSNIVLIAFFVVLCKQICIELIHLKKQGVILIFIALVFSVIFKFDWNLHFFGLEYEDAYVFNHSARLFSEGIYTKNFLTDGILLGSLNNPLSTGTYGGHFITFPVFLTWFYKNSGFQASNPGQTDR